MLGTGPRAYFVRARLCPSLKIQPIAVLGVDIARILGTDLSTGECSSGGVSSGHSWGPACFLLLLLLLASAAKYIASLPSPSLP